MSSLRVDLSILSSQQSHQDVTQRMVRSFALVWLGTVIGELLPTTEIEGASCTLMLTSILPSRPFDRDIRTLRYRHYHLS